MAKETLPTRALLACGGSRTPHVGPAPSSSSPCPFSRRPGSGWRRWPYTCTDLRRREAMTFRRATGWGVRH